MKIVGLDRLLKSPKGEVLQDKEAGNKFPLGDTLYIAAYSELKGGMTSEERSKANALGVKIAVCLQLNEQSENSEIPLDLKPKEATLLLDLATVSFGTMLFGAIEKALEDGGILEGDEEKEEQDETSDEEIVEDP